MTISPYEVYQNDVAYLTKMAEHLQSDVSIICSNGAIANIPWETRSDLIDRIDAISRADYYVFPDDVWERIVHLRFLLGSLPRALWDHYLNSVALCKGAFLAPEWQKIIEACKEVRPGLLVACEAVGVAAWLR